MRVFLLLCAASSVALAAGLRHLGPTDPAVPAWLTALVLVLVSIVNVEMGRALSGGRREFPDSLRDVLFQRFTREAETARKVTGTGLGLFITRELARANGGDVAYRSRSASGSVFAITLPTSSAAVPLER